MPSRCSAVASFRVRTAKSASVQRCNDLSARLVTISRRGNTRSACRKITGSVSGNSIINPCIARDCSSGFELVDSRYCSCPTARRTVFAPMKTLFTVLLLGAVCAPLRAQTIDDGIMMTARSIQTGVVYTRDTWDEYWEGTLKRTNGNIGAITTQSDAWTAVYGVTNRVMVLANVPFVWTRPSQGVLQGQHGMQDITVGGKYSFLERSSDRWGALRAMVALSG